MVLRNPAWTRDELILALDLYFHHHPSHISNSHPEVRKLSETLNLLPIHKDRPDAVRFRNENSVYTKLYEEAKRFSLFTLKAVLNGRGGEIVDLAKSICSARSQQRSASREEKGGNNNGYAAAIDKGIRFTG